MQNVKINEKIDVSHPLEEEFGFYYVKDNTVDHYDG